MKAVEQIHGPLGAIEREDQLHRNPEKTRENLLRNGATGEEAEFIAGGERVELNTLTGPQFIEFVTEKLIENGVEKVIPDEQTLAAAWRRAHLARRVNTLIERIQSEGAEASNEAGSDGGFLQDDVPAPPTDLAEQLREAFADEPEQSWDEALWCLADGTFDNQDEGSA